MLSPSAHQRRTDGTTPLPAAFTEQLLGGIEERTHRWKRLLSEKGKPPGRQPPRIGSARHGDSSGADSTPTLYHLFSTRNLLIKSSSSRETDRTSTKHFTASFAPRIRQKGRMGPGWAGEDAQLPTCMSRIGPTPRTDPFPTLEVLWRTPSPSLQDIS